MFEYPELPSLGLLRRLVNTMKTFVALAAVLVVVAVLSVYSSMLRSEESYSTDIRLPLRVGIIITVDPLSLAQRQLDVLLMAWNCYALRHNYRVFYVPRVFKSDFSLLNYTGRNEFFEFFQGRLRVYRSYLEQLDVLLGVDGDTVIVNVNKSLLDFLGPDDHVVLQQRQNKQICAGVLLIRNSMEGRKFLDAWIALGSHNHIDADNGRLHMLLLKLFDQRMELKKCWALEKAGRIAWEKYFQLFECLQDGLKYELHSVRRDGILILPSFGGFMRDFGRNPGVRWWDEPPFNCVLENDFILHGRNLMTLVGPALWMCDRAAGLRKDAPFYCANVSVTHRQCQMTHPKRDVLRGSHICQVGEPLALFSRRRRMEQDL